MIDVSDLIGVPYKVNGRDIRKGLDCIGLAIEVERRFGHKLPDKEDFCADVKNRNFEKLAASTVSECSVKEINKPTKEGDVILFKDVYGMLFHIGIYLGNNIFIHCNKYGVHTERLNSFSGEIGKVYTWL